VLLATKSPPRRCHESVSLDRVICKCSPVCGSIHHKGRFNALVALSRRQLLIASGLGAVAGVTSCGSAHRPALPAPARTTAPVKGVDASAFSLGVASGDPLPDSVLLWTRLAPDPMNGGGMPQRPVDVQWQVASDEGFTKIAASGTSQAVPALGHSVHADAQGLQPATGYFYRFRVGNAISPVGRTRTAPKAGANLAQLRFAVANCQNYAAGYWPAYTHLSEESLDLVLHVGDYIYEYAPAAGDVRKHSAVSNSALGRCVTLEDYRNRYGQYKSDAALRAAHAAFPWVLTWDDHEVQNDYANLVEQPMDAGALRESAAAFALHRAAAYQAYYEHQPIRATLRPGSPDLKIYRRFGFGSLATLNVLDTRQYRTPHPCGQQDFGPASCGADNTTGTLTGAAQEAWLREGLRSSRTAWDIVAQQTLMTQVKGRLGDARLILVDQNDGYGPYRTRIMQMLAERPSPVVLSGDIHSSWVSDLRVDFDRPETPAIAAEFCTTSISSDFKEELEPLVRAQLPTAAPQVRHFSGAKRGYTRHTVTPETWRCDYRVVADVKHGPSSPVSTESSWVVEAKGKIPQQA
jgi:alkaline phosphatase D